MNYIKILCDNQPFHLYLTPYTGDKLTSNDPIIIEPLSGSRCDHYGYECSRCAMFHSPSCGSYRELLSFITSNYTDQFQDYPELLL